MSLLTHSPRIAGLLDARYSFSAAVDLFRTVINFALLISVNRFAKLLGQSGLW